MEEHDLPRAGLRAGFPDTGRDAVHSAHSFPGELAFPAGPGLQVTVDVIRVKYGHCARLFLACCRCGALRRSTLERDR